MLVPAATGDDPERAGGQGERGRDAGPVDHQIPGRTLRAIGDQPHPRDHPCQIGPLVRRTEHDDAVRAREIGRVRQCHPAAHDEVAQRVPDEPQAVRGQARDDVPEGPGVRVDVGPHAGVAEAHDRAVDPCPQMVRQRLHRIPALAQAVEQDRGGPAQGGHGPLLLERPEGVAALRRRAPLHDPFVRIDDAVRIIPCMALEPPVVPDDLVRPFERLAGPPHALDPRHGGGLHGGIGPDGRRRHEHHERRQRHAQPASGPPQGDRDHRYWVQPRDSSSATTFFTASSWARSATSVASGVCTTSIFSRPSVTTR